MGSVIEVKIRLTQNRGCDGVGRRGVSPWSLFGPSVSDLFSSSDYKVPAVLIPLRERVF